MKKRIWCCEEGEGERRDSFGKGLIPPLLPRFPGRASGLSTFFLCFLIFIHLFFLIFTFPLSRCRQGWMPCVLSPSLAWLGLSPPSFLPVLLSSSPSPPPIGLQALELTRSSIDPQITFHSMLTLTLSGTHSMYVHAVGM
ncbi:hypothetical protein IE53DRAFT_217121 [Violaceomyces palustris]|uniref:Uncharacterized protein n=1 Tax=Violaceomyces palustris TaxID=1673888 RepID=A0ACD0P4U4_9BASI|nr:hypothetical protein IE53DRAFT_217121 [Violaceomyces palustris]